MNVTQQGIVTLIKSAITGQCLPLPEGFSLQEAMPLIKRHHITALAHQGAVHCGVDGNDPAMQKLFGYHCKNVQVSTRQMTALEAVFAEFEKAGIEYMPLKGCRQKALYPKPELRSMGDADVLIRLEQYARCRTILQEMGFEEKSESDHELPWVSSRLYLELHKRVIPSYNKDFYAYFGDGWQLATEGTHLRRAMSRDNEWIYLFSHFAKHCRDGGIGCRHMTDLWVYRRHHPDLDEQYVRRELEKLQLLEFYGYIMQLLQVWFEDAQSDERLDALTGYIFRSGSWGANDSRVLSQTLRDAQHISVRSGGKLTYIFKTLFPPVLVLRDKYTVLKKAPWMLPAVWVWRPFYKVIFERDTLGKQRENLRAVRSERMVERHQFLDYIGLGYHF